MEDLELKKQKNVIILITIILIVVILVGAAYIFITKSNNKELNSRELQIGDYINYNPDVVEDYVWDSEFSGYSFGGSMSQDTISKWRVFSIDEDKIQLISDTPTSEDILLADSDAYNNSVWLLNDMCKNLWSKSGVGIARSININDILSVSNYDKSKYNNGQFTYGDVQEFSKNMKYPNLFVHEIASDANSFNIGSLKESDSLINDDGTANVITGNSSTVVKAKQTFYSFESSTVENEIQRKMLFQSVSYLVASRYVDVSDNIEFGVRGVFNGTVKTQIKQSILLFGCVNYV